MKEFRTEKILSFENAYNDLNVTCVLNHINLKYIIFSDKKSQSWNEKYTYIHVVKKVTVLYIHVNIHNWLWIRFFFLKSSKESCRYTYHAGYVCTVIAFPLVYEFSSCRCLSASMFDCRFQADQGKKIGEGSSSKSGG